MNRILPQFQKFMTDRKLAAENQIPFYAGWASKFIYFSNVRQSTPTDLKIQLFLDALRKNPKIQDWQITQAENAVKLYVDHFLSKNPSAPVPERRKKVSVSFTMRPLSIRKSGRHCGSSIRPTARKRPIQNGFNAFYTYLTMIKKKDWDARGADEEDVRDFLSHLAIKQHVSSSTQNQAFNALLFLFRNVLQIDLKDLSQTVRAKRGQKLPVVLSVDEVRQLLSQLSGRDLLLVHIIYKTGVRVMEAARLRVNDVDFGSNMIFVRGGKGDKDRTTILPEAVKEPLKEHLVSVQER